MTSQIVCVPVTPTGEVDRRWGKAAHVALARLQDGAVVDWRVVDVGWDRLHDEGGEGQHHARIVRFLRDNGVAVVVAGGMGPPMQNTLAKLGVRTVLGVTGDARAAATSGGLAAH
ncbi:MAG TPA: NifB/NifX family molybdenum-iron cluster-binding protein [Marmoricola sp.]|nr:NifB/NifX family molybdenum-iron cluster-binding protein [Marmoricola sp.]